MFGCFWKPHGFVKSIPKISCTIFTSCGCDTTCGDDGEAPVSVGLALTTFLWGEETGPVALGTTGIDMVGRCFTLC